MLTTLQELRALPQYFTGWQTGSAVPHWATRFLSSFPWSAARVQACVEAALNPSVCPEPDTVELTCEDAEEELMSEDDPEVDIAEAALDRNLARWQQQRDSSPSPPTTETAASSSSGSSRQVPLSVSLSKAKPKRDYKSGHCPIHLCARSPRVFSERSVKAGQAAYVCNKFFQRNAQGKPMCFHFVKAARADISRWPVVPKNNFFSLQSAFARGGQKHA